MFNVSNCYAALTAILISLALTTTTSTSAAAFLNLFEEQIADIYQECGLANNKLDFEVFKKASIGYYNLQKEGKIKQNKKQLSIIDFQKPSKQKRLYIVDMEKRSILKHTWVAHGRNSGLQYANKFSNIPESLQSSLGFYKTARTYSGKHGYSLRLDGLEYGINHKARARAIVMHGADYVSASFLRSRGRLGRSWGCPAVSYDEHKEIINKIKFGSCLFIYAPDKKYVEKSRYLDEKEAALYCLNIEEDCLDEYYASNSIAIGRP